MALRRVERKKEKRKKMMMSLFIAFIMVASLFGVIFYGNSNSNSVKDYGINFEVTQNNQFLAKVGGEQRLFYVLPTEAESISTDEGVFDLLRSSSSLVYSFDPSMDTDNLVIIDVVRYDLDQSIMIPTSSAIDAENGDFTLPVWACDNATEILPVVHFSESNASSISLNGYCIEVRGNNTDFLVARDRIIYEYYGVY